MDGGTSGINPGVPATSALSQIQNLAKIEAQFTDPKFATLRNLIMKLSPLMQPKGAPVERVKTEPKTAEKPKQQQKVSKKAVKPEPQTNSQPQTPRKQKKPEFKQCASRGVRHVYQPYLRDISTPDWSGDFSSTDQLNVIENFDIVEAHREMEIYEARILGGGDVLHCHPILARKAKEEDSGLVLSKHEYDKSMRYETIPVIEKAPDFWPMRAWDRPDTRMTKAETEETEKKLKYEEEKIMEICSVQRVSPIVTPKRTLSSTGVKVKKMKSTVVKLDPIYYLTDDSDATEMEDC